MSGYFQETRVCSGEVMKGDLCEASQRNETAPGEWRETWIYSWQNGTLCFHVGPAMVGPDAAHLNRLRLYGDGRLLSQLRAPLPGDLQHISDFGLEDVEVWPGGFVIVDLDHLFLAPFGNRVPEFVGRFEIQIPLGTEGTVEEVAGW